MVITKDNERGHKPAEWRETMKTIIEITSNYNTETGTTTQTRILPLFEFYELSDDAQEKAIEEYAEERANDPFLWQVFAENYERDIWECVKHLEDSINCARVEWEYNRFYSCDFDCEYKIKNFDWLEPDTNEEIQNNGYYASFDICNAWNAHARKMNALALMYEYICEQIQALPYEPWVFNSKPENMAFCEKLEYMSGEITDKWLCELEKACDDVRNAIETLLRGEWEYYTSEEYTRLECEDEFAQGSEYRQIDNNGRVYYSDSRRWYTANGEFYEQSNISHECVSIVKCEVAR